MGLLDRLFGPRGTSPSTSMPTPRPPDRGVSADEQALERYRYLLRTAPPEAIERAHAEAFAQLTPAQRAQALRELSQTVPEAERARADDQPQTLARMATRAEMRQPGTLERVFSGGGGMGGMLAGSLLGSIAGTFIGTAIAHQFLDGFGDSSWSDEGGLDSAQADASEHGDDSGFDDVGGGFDGDFLDV
ncbi:hypothetical protein [Melittangium boletus]|uniref:DUF2076 domain-containing protein n=1 Tax=Melittangium boletus DSM 14713 TaxID=1294270 RepID=A0A250IQP7_9BACT|nr:hypothetical protein [Melittangium boletus]ATB34069.1 hypothetical protein MEBOL_007570 [Melittangium boletus DSM 14713]